MDQGRRPSTFDLTGEVFVQSEHEECCSNLNSRVWNRHGKGNNSLTCRYCVDRREDGRQNPEQENFARVSLNSSGSVRKLILVFVLPAWSQQLRLFHAISMAFIFHLHLAHIKSSHAI